MSTGAGPTRLIFLGLFLISAATLLFQVTFTRIFSASIWYHFAFLVVSIALFGFGASGVVLSLERTAGRGPIRPSWSAALFGATTVLAYLGTNAIPFSPFRLLQSPIQFLYFLLYVVLLAAPFLFAGLTTGLLLREWPARASRLYAIDLAGAASGTLLVFLALPRLGAPATVFLAAGIAFISAACLAPELRLRSAFAGLCALVVPFLVAPALIPDVRVDETKLRASMMEDGRGRIAYAAWNMLSRIDVVERPDQDPAILIDSAAMTWLRPSGGDPARLRARITSLAYQLRKQAGAVIIGSGGGENVQTALALGARRVTAVEINPTIVDLVQGRYRNYIGGVFSDPRVRLVRDEGRSFIQRSGELNDVIELTLIDTWAAGASGAYSLSENYLYTTDAFRAYYRHLSPDGLLAITRWTFEAPRLLALGRAALVSLGIQDPAAHLLLLGQDRRVLFLMKRAPFTADELGFVRQAAQEHEWEILHDPLQPNPRSAYDQLLSSPDPEAQFASSWTTLRPVGDDSPFFFQMGRWRNLKLGSLASLRGGSFLQPLSLPVGQVVLLSALLLGLLLSVGLLAIPLRLGAVPREDRYLWLGYFAALGVAYMMVEVVLMQRFALFLGHPTYSVTVVLLSLLLFSGLGAWLSDPRRGTISGVLRPVAFGLPPALLLLAFAAPPVIRSWIGLPHPARVLIAVALIAPVGTLMGVPFPVGIRAAGSSHSEHVPWAWAANGCGSVIGSSCAVLGAMIWNFSTMLVVAAALYALALWGVGRKKTLAV